MRAIIKLFIYVALQFLHRSDRYRVVKRAIEEDQAHKNPLYFHNQFSDIEA
jgi:hypothetical protein